MLLNGVVDQAVPILEAGRLTSRLPEEEAIALLGLSARGHLPGTASHSHDTGGGTGHGFDRPPDPVVLEGSELALFREEWDAAVAAAERLATWDKAVATGYTQSSTEDPGVGTHLIK
jgi:hypothetical protein